MMNSHLCEASSPPPTTLAMHKDSHMISKLQPKIRIVHIFAPEIIKTDVANFRELVQRLTGKPSKRSVGGGAGAGGKRKVGSSWQRNKTEVPPCIDVKVTGCRSSGCGERVIKGEQEEIGSWIGDNSGGLFGGLGDLDGFVQGLSEFPALAPLSSFT